MKTKIIQCIAGMSECIRDITKQERFEHELTLEEMEMISEIEVKMEALVSKLEKETTNENNNTNTNGTFV